MREKDREILMIGESGHRNQKSGSAVDRAHGRCSGLESYSDSMEIRFAL